MVNKAVRYLTNTINQEKLFKSIEKDIREIIEPYNFKKIIRIESEHVGELKITMQDPIPTILINELNDYIGLYGVLKKYEFSIALIYKIEKDSDKNVD